MFMPADLLIRRLGRLADDGVLTHSDYTALALDIDTELQEKFVFIPYEEIEAVKIENRQDNADDPTLQAGSGPETIRANGGDNPSWLYNAAVHALAMWQHLCRLEEQAQREQVLARRPRPGVYQAEAANYFTVIVTEDLKVLVQMGSGGLADRTKDWDDMAAAGSSRLWKLQRIDTVTGTLAPQ